VTAFLMRWISRAVVRTPVLVLIAVGAITAVLYSHVHYLRMGTDLTEMFGRDDPQWRVVSQLGRELGYGNQLFVLVEAGGGEESAGPMEEFADRLIAGMNSSGLFKYARSGLQDEELLQIVRLHVWNFPAYTLPGQRDEIRGRLTGESIRRTFRKASSQMVTPFSALGTNYFLVDPLGLMEPLARGSKGFSQFTSFDLNWGSGNRFFSKDHRSLLIITQPRESAVDYQFAEQMMAWMRRTIRATTADAAFRDAGLRVTPAGAYVYAEQDRQFIQKNIRLISLISIVGNLVLCLLVYPRIPLFLLSLLPTSLGILWTTGVASYYPGEVNLISMSFIAILAGLGDDQVVHFFNRVPQEWVNTGSLEGALTRTFQLTGPSILFCILTASVATASLALSSFKVLAEFGFILTVGMFMMMVHTLLTVPALMRLWWRFSKPRAPETITFRFLPFVTRHTVNFVGRHARLVAGIAAGAFVLSLASLPMVRMSAKIEISRGEDNPAIAGQRRLSAAFGIEGSPEVLLLSGSQEEVLRRSEELTSRLESYQRSGLVRTVFTPTTMVPSRRTQAERRAALSGVDFEAAALAVEASIRDNGFRREPFQPFLEHLRELGRVAPPVTVETATAYVPAGLLDNSIRKTAAGEYLAAIAYYGTDPDATEVIPGDVLRTWRRQCGPFIDFSFNKINRDMQSHILGDSRRALLLTAFGILLIVYLSFRNLRDSLLVVLPIVFAISATFAVLLLFRHRFSFMSVTAIPLIIGIGIDNGIHLIRRYRETGDRSILEVAQASGAALIQSNLTTMVGFGALTASTFAPLAEMGLVTVLGVSLALAAALIAVPAVILVARRPVPGEAQ
jgi:hypothetical protein